MHICVCWGFNLFYHGHILLFKLRRQCLPFRVSVLCGSSPEAVRLSPRIKLELGCSLSCLPICLASFWNHFFFFFLAMQHVGSSFPYQGSNPCLLHWKLRVLTTRLPRKSPAPLSILLLPPWIPLPGMLLFPLLNVPRLYSVEAQSQVHWSRRPSWYPQKIEVSLLL